ncbi:hypothetical protein Clacol_006533 [Clathrus columnatus]|uniref:Large ribosomal subunit protein mL54 n=1 Tax=Clathrus columnatus TaxID=1419009 RepID=A0AAV5AEX2_9AGAM|nr:hypothetical protein Clacol_006533 [Clathrus columnatus]
MSLVRYSWTTLSKRHLTSSCRLISTTGKLLDSRKEKDLDKVAAPISSCSSGTVLKGLAYLKDQPPVVALPDEEYPPWLWTIMLPKVWPEDGPGGKAEKVRLRKESRQKIKDQNFMKTQ